MSEPYLLTADGARCRVWPDGPDWDGAPSAAIGGLEVPNAASGAALLLRACEQLARLGRARVLAPINGDTWHSYRAVTETDGSPSWALEPVSGPHDAAALAAAKFLPVGNYVSSRAPVPAASELPTLPGVVVRAWDGTGTDALIDRLFAFAGASFADKRFFKPIDSHAFRALYRPLLPAIDPRLVLFACDDAGELVGFLFGYPDWLQGASRDIAVLKTYASLRPGVGHLLAATFHERARDLGFAHVIHALMYVDNVSLQRSALHGGRVFRRYSLFGRQVA